MSNPNFEPIIGDSFSDIGRQRFAYAGFNANIENQNMARAAQAQQEQNRWLFALAQMQRQDAAEAGHQDSLDRSAYDSSVARQDKLNSDAEHRREFDVSSEIQREAEKEKNNYLKWHYQIADKEKKVDLDSIEATANYMAPQASEAVKNLQKAGKDLDETQRELNNAGNDAMSNLQTKGRYTYDPKSGALVPVIKGAPVMPEDVEALTAADKQIADKRSAFLAAKRSHDEAVQYLRSIRTQAGQYGLIMGDDGKLFSPKHQKAFGEVAKSGEQPDGSGDAGGAFPDASAMFNPRLTDSLNQAVGAPGSGAWAGFNPQTVTATNPPPAAAPLPQAETPPDDSGWAGFTPTNAPPVLPATNAPVTVAASPAVTNIGRFKVRVISPTTNTAPTSPAVPIAPVAPSLSITDSPPNLTPLGGRSSITDAPPFGLIGMQRASNVITDAPPSGPISYAGFNPPATNSAPSIADPWTEIQNMRRLSPGALEYVKRVAYADGKDAGKSPAEVDTAIAELITRVKSGDKKAASFLDMLTKSGVVEMANEEVQR